MLRRLRTMTYTCSTLVCYNWNKIDQCAIAKIGVSSIIARDDISVNEKIVEANEEALNADLIKFLRGKTSIQSFHQHCSTEQFWLKQNLGQMKNSTTRNNSDNTKDRVSSSPKPDVDVCKLKDVRIANLNVNNLIKHLLSEIDSWEFCHSMPKRRIRVGCSTRRLSGN